MSESAVPAVAVSLESVLHQSVLTVAASVEVTNSRLLLAAQ